MDFRNLTVNDESDREHKAIIFEAVNFTRHKICGDDLKAPIIFD